VSGDGIVSVIWYMISFVYVQEIEPQPRSLPSLSLNRNDYYYYFYFSENEREEAAVACTLSRSEGGRTGGVPGTCLGEWKAVLDEGARARKNTHTYYSCAHRTLYTNKTRVPHLEAT
jgi:hypothetical protein